MSEEQIALVIGAHPDDCEFGAGLTAYAWSRKGWQVHFLVATDGSRGTPDPSVDRTELAALRKQEQVEAAQHLLVRSCNFLGREDGVLIGDESLLKEIVKAIREIKPKVVFTHTPEVLDYRPFDRREGAGVNHKDHRALATTVVDAVYPCARDPHYFPELQLAPHKVSRLCFWGAKEPTFKVKSVSGLQRKLEALALHKSQFAGKDWGALKSMWAPEESFLRIDLPG